MSPIVVVSSLRTCTKCGESKPETVDNFATIEPARNDKQVSGRFYAYCRTCSPPKLISPKGLKVCRACGEMKPATREFFRTNGSAGYLKPVCKACLNKPPAPPTPAGMKRCMGCSQAKPASEAYFYRRTSQGGLRSVCIECAAAQAAVRSVKPPEMGPELPPGSTACRLCHTCKDATEVNFPRRPSGNLAGICRKCQAKKTADYRTKILGTEQALRAKLIAHEYRSESLRQRLKRHEVRAGCQSDLAVTPLDVIRKMDDQDCRCHWCQDPIAHNYVIDHIIPLSRGGAHSVDNICCACPDCNWSKGAKLPEEWPGRPR